MRLKYKYAFLCQHFFPDLERCLIVIVSISDLYMFLVFLRPNAYYDCEEKAVR